MKKIIIALVLSIAMMSCTTATFTGLQVSKEAPMFEALGDFSVDVADAKFVGMSGGMTLVNIGQGSEDAKVQAAIMAEIEALGGDGVVNVSIVQNLTAVNVILNMVTGNLYAPCTYTITGTVVKY